MTSQSGRAVYYKQRPVLLAAFLLCLGSSCTSDSDKSASDEIVVDSGDCERRSINDVQQIGSHNSYRQIPPGLLLDALDTWREGYSDSLMYQHPPLYEQLDLGLRLVELDIFLDPSGGRFASPAGLELLGPADPRPFNTEEMSRPGLKVFHLQEYDIYSSCVTFLECLKELKRWSSDNQGHSLIAVTTNVKEFTPEFNGATEALEFSSAALDSVDQAIQSVFDRSQLFVPDDVRGMHSTLRAAVVEDGWPTFAETVGKFMYILDASTEDPALRYREGHPSLQGRVMFAEYDQAADEASFMNVWDIVGREDEVATLVKSGFLVRAAADIGTKEARAVDTARFEAAANAGVQLIATDFYPGNDSPIDTEYEVTFPGGNLFRCD